MIVQPSRLRQLPRILHIAWAMPTAIVAILFTTSTRGDPPAVVYLPLILLVWVAGHVLIRGAAAVARSAGRKRGAGRGWPLSVLLSMFATGIVAVAGLLLVLSILLTRTGPSGPVEVLVLVMVWAVHVLAFTGLLMRTDRGRQLTALAALAWISLIVLTQIQHRVGGLPFSAVETAAAVVATGSIAWLAVRLLTGDEEKTCTTPSGRPEAPGEDRTADAD